MNTKTTRKKIIKGEKMLIEKIFLASNVRKNGEERYDNNISKILGFS